MEFKCVLEGCGKKFKAGEWDCYPGQPHEVEEKTYRIGTGVDKVEDRAKQRVRVYYTADIKKQDAQGNPFVEQALACEFVRGMLTTQDPKIILFMETKYKANLISEEAWEKLYIHEKDLIGMKQRELEQKTKVAQAEENELLQRVQKAKEELADIEKKKAKAEKETVAAK
jgi:hypothetical protein